MGYTLRSSLSVSLAAIAIAIGVSACGTKSSFGPCPEVAAAVAEPYIQLLYPEPNSTGVVITGSALIYNASTSYPIEISATGEPVVALVPTALPSPLPSPIATSGNSSSDDRAVRLPALTSATTYTVLARIDAACGPSPTEEITIGSFTTR